MKSAIRWASALLGACALLIAPAAAGARPASATAAATVPASFQPAAESFITPSWGVVLGGVGCRFAPTCRARLVVTAGGGAHWRFLTAHLVDGRRRRDRLRDGLPHLG